MPPSLPTCQHDHPPLPAGAVMQFHPVAVELPGRFLRMEPYQPADIEVEQRLCGFTMRGHYGFELFQGHRFEVTVDGQRRTFERWEDIPEVIDAVVRFAPGNDAHDIDFTIHYKTDGQVKAFTQNVHNESCGWVERLQQLLARERRRRRPACPQ